MSTIAEKLSHPEFALPVSKAMIVGSAFSGLARGNFFDPRSFDSASRFLKGVLERIFVGSGERKMMRYSHDQHMKMAKRLHERAKQNPDPEKAKKQAAMANTFRLLARRAAKQGAKSG